MPWLIDCHLHLQDQAFEDDVAGVMDRAARSGVVGFVCNGSCERDWPAVLELSRRYPQIVPCFGLHPWYVADRSDSWLVELEHMLDAVPSAVGEIGLDRWIEPRDEKAQEAVFRSQLDVARRRGVPVMVHCLRAWRWLLDVLRSEPLLPAGVLIHAYGGSAELIRPLADFGAYFSFAGNVLESGKVRQRESLAAVPLDRLLIETDSPDLPPPTEMLACLNLRPDGRVRNEPCNLPIILRGVARVRNMAEDALAKIIGQNARRLLGGLVR